MRISQLEAIARSGGRIALWGWGMEGRAAYTALRARDAALPMTLLCSAQDVDDACALGDAALAVQTEVDADALALFAVVIKSPGISPYRPEAQAAAARGTRFVGGTLLWFGEHAGAHGELENAVCITGTKGKSTSSALLAHLLRAGGHVTALAGNIGLPLLELLAPKRVPEYWAIELSSYQTLEVAASGVRPQVGVVLNVFPEHLDWHGSEQRYIDDKLSLVTQAAPRVAVLNAADARLAALQLPRTQVQWFGREDGWHLRGDVLHRGAHAVLDTAGLPLPGRHNRANLCAVLTAIEALGLDAATLAPHAASFQPLPHRLQSLGTRAGITYVNDSISTTPHASLAALDCFAQRPVAILVGGHDRGLDWGVFVEAIRRRPPAAIITMGQHGARIFEQLAPVAAQSSWVLGQAPELEDAMRQGIAALPGGGVLLLSPGAPSFDAYRDYTARGRHFAQAAGFDPDRISAIAGLGVA